MKFRRSEMAAATEEEQTETRDQKNGFKSRGNFEEKIINEPQV